MRFPLLTALAGLALLGTARAADPAPIPPMRTQVYCVADLVVPIPGHIRPATESPAFPPAVPFGQPSAAVNGAKLVKIVTGTVRPYSWSAMGGPGNLSYHDVGYALVVNQTDEVLKEVGTLLEALRKLQDVSVCCEVRVLTGPVGFVAAAGLTTTGEKCLTEQQVRQLLEGVQSNKRVEVRQYPKVTTFDGQTATVRCCDQQTFVSGVEATRVNGAVVMVPKNTAAELGDTLTICGRLTADRKFVTLRTNLTHTANAGPVEMVPVVTQITPVFEGGSQGVPVPFTQYLQAPELKTVSLDRTAVVPDGGTVVLGCWKEASCETRAGTPPAVRKPVAVQLQKFPPLAAAPAVERESVAIATVRVCRTAECAPVQAQPCPAPQVCQPPVCPTPATGLPLPVYQPTAATPLQTKPQPTTAMVYKLQNTAAVDVAHALNAQFGREKRPVTVTAEPVSNTLVVSAGGDHIQQIVKLIEKLDAAPPSVLVDVLVVRVPADFMEKAGLRKPDEVAGGKPAELTEREYRMFNVLLRQAKQDGTVEVISRPQIMVMDNQTGHVQVGGHHPSPVPATANQPAQIEMVPVGLNARVTPRVSPDGRVLLRVETNFTEPTPSPVNLGNGVTTTAFNVESMQTTVTLKDGATAVLGCGQRTREVRHEFRVPTISSIPYLDRLFTNVGYATERTELLVLVTPRVVKPTPVAAITAAVSPPPMPVVRPLPAPPPMTLAVPVAAPALPRPTVTARPVSAPTTVTVPAPRPAVPVCCEAACDKAKAAELVRAYHKACAAGDKDAATRCAVQALALDPTCFAPAK